MNMVLPLPDNRILIPVVLALFTVGVAVSPLSYQTLDEVILRSLHQGSFLGYDGVDPRYAIQPNILYSKALAALYAFAPGLPWHDLVFFGAGLLSVAALLWCALDAVEAGTERVVRALVVLFLCYVLFVHPQFTTTAGLVGVSGILLAIHAAETDQARPGVLLCVMAALVISGLIRYPMLQLVVLASGLVFLPTCLRLLRHRRRSALKVLTVLSITHRHWILC